MHRRPAHILICSPGPCAIFPSDPGIFHVYILVGANHAADPADVGAECKNALVAACGCCQGRQKRPLACFCGTADAKGATALVICAGGRTYVCPPLTPEPPSSVGFAYSDKPCCFFRYLAVKMLIFFTIQAPLTILEVRCGLTVSVLFAGSLL